MKLHCTIHRWCCVVVLGSGLSWTPNAFSQLEVDDLEITSPGNTALNFTDSGSGATGYEIESSFNLEPGSWSLSDFTLSDLGNGMWQANVTGLDPQRSFLRVKLLGLEETVRAYFSADSLAEVAEGSMPAITVYFTQPYTGPLYYRWAGTAAVENPTGVVNVDGTTAQIELSLLENTSIDELTFLSLTLETAGDTGYVLDDAAGGSTRFTLNVSDDDSLWLGSFSANGLELDLGIELITQSGVATAQMVSEASSILGEESVSHPADTTTLNETDFHALFASVSIPSSADNGLGANTSVDLELTSDTVSGSLIQGQASLTIDPGQPHLITTLPGTFTLARRPSPQSTAEIPFVQ